MYANDGLLFFPEDSGDVTFCCNEIGILSVNLNNISLDNNFDEDDPDTIILGLVNLRNAKHLKISEELMPIAWHPRRWWNVCNSEDEKKEIEPIFTELCY